MARRQARSATTTATTTITETMPAMDPEAGEASPLIGEPPPLQDIKEHYAKEKAVAGVAGASCK